MPASDTQEDQLLQLYEQIEVDEIAAAIEQLEEQFKPRTDYKNKMEGVRQALQSEFPADVAKEIYKVCIDTINDIQDDKASSFKCALISMKQGNYPDALQHMEQAVEDEELADAFRETNRVYQRLYQFNETLYLKYEKTPRRVYYAWPRPA